VSGKIASSIALLINNKEIRDRAAISYLFQLYPNSYLYERRRKTANSHMKLF
jgi:hypothetical protein